MDDVPLVLLHGLATTRVVWHWATPPLNHVREVVAVDVPGFGAAAPAGPGFDLAQVADRVLEELPVDGPFALLGHSMGGAVALTLADRHPERVHRLVLAAPAGLRALPARVVGPLAPLATAGIRLRRTAAPLARLAPAKRLLLTGGVADPTRISAEQAQVMFTASRGATRITEALTAVACADLRDVLARLPEAPGLVWGSRDRVVPVGLADTVRALRPDARVAIVPDAGHIAMVERPRAFAAAVEEVL